MTLNPTRREIAEAAKAYENKGGDQIKPLLKKQIGEVGEVYDQLTEQCDWSKVTKLDGDADSKRDAFRGMNAHLAALRDRMREIQEVESSVDAADRADEIAERNGGSRPSSRASNDEAQRLASMAPSDRERMATTRFLTLAAEQSNMDTSSPTMVGKESISYRIANKVDGVDHLDIPLDYLVGPRAPRNVLTSGQAGASGGGSQIGTSGFSIYPPMTDMIVALPFPPTRIMDIVRRQRTSSNLYVYRAQTSPIQLDYADADNANTRQTKTGWRGENEAGQEIGPKWETQSSAVQKCLAYAEITDEQIEDGEDVDALVAEQLMFELRNAVERDLLIGPGGDKRMTGLLNGVGTEAQAAGTATVPTWGLDMISKASMTIMQDVWMMPDRVVMTPLAWHSLSTARDNDGRLQFMDPTEAAALRVLGLPVVLSPFTSETKGNANTTVGIGAFSTAAALVDRRDVRIARTDAHDANFTKDVITIKASVRVANARYYAKAFRTVTDFGGRKQP